LGGAQASPESTDRKENPDENGDRSNRNDVPNAFRDYLADNSLVGKRVQTKGFGLAIDGRRLPVFCPNCDSALEYARSRIDE
jgi:hypothetical protein